MVLPKRKRERNDWLPSPKGLCPLVSVGCLEQPEAGGGLSETSYQLSPAGGGPEPHRRFLRTGVVRGVGGRVARGEYLQSHNCDYSWQLCVSKFANVTVTDSFKNCTRFCP